MWIIRFLRTLSLYSLMVASLVLFVLSSLNPKLFDKIRGGILDTIAPVILQVENVIAYGYGIQDKIRDILRVYQENQRLIAKQADYTQKSVRLALLQQQVKDLQNALNYKDTFGVPDGFMAKIITFSGGAYDRSYILDKGANDGVHVGQVIVFDGYMAGYIIDVSDVISRAIPLTNINASVPVMDRDRKSRGMVLGDGVKLPKFIFADTITDFQEGDNLYTSGDGGVFPVGLPVAQIQKIYNHNNIRVTPFIRQQDMKLVYILQHQPQVLLQGD